MTLLEKVKIHLDLTSYDLHTETKVKSAIADAKQHLRRYAPDLTDDDFENELKNAHFLLKHYCRYAYSNAEEMFDVNFKSELLDLRREYEVRAYEEKNAN